MDQSFSKRHGLEPAPPAVRTRHEAPDSLRLAVIQIPEDQGWSPSVLRGVICRVLHARRPLDGVDPLQWRRELGLDPLGRPLADRELERSIGAGRKLTETLLDFARPMIDALAGSDARSMRTLLEFSIRIWNAIVDEETGGAAGFLAEIRAELLAGRTPSEIVTWHDKLVARKRELFRGDLRFVGNWNLRQDRGGVHVEMETRVSAALQARLEGAGYKAQG